jgi:hypothetical protein
MPGSDRRVRLRNCPAMTRIPHPLQQEVVKPSFAEAATCARGRASKLYRMFEAGF